MNRPGSWSRRAFLRLGLLFLARPVLAQDISPTGPEAGANLAAKLCLIRPAEDMEWSGTLTMSHRTPKIPPVPVVCRASAGDSSWSRTYMTAPVPGVPAEMLTVIFSSNAPPKYLYARAPDTNSPVGALKPLTAAEANIPLAGSDFWLSDLGLDFFHWPVQIQSKGELRSGRGCWVLESMDPHPPTGGYSRVKTWVDKEYGQPMEAYAYRADKTNNVLKSFVVGSATKMNDGHYELKNIKMNNRVTGSTTDLVFNLDGK